MSPGKIDTEDFARAVMRLSGDEDWNTVVRYLEASYDNVKEILVGCDTPANEVNKGRAQALRQMLTDIRGARSTLDRFDASRRMPKGSAIP